MFLPKKRYLPQKITYTTAQHQCNVRHSGTYQRHATGAASRSLSCRMKHCIARPVLVGGSMFREWSIIENIQIKYLYIFIYIEPPTNTGRAIEPMLIVTGPYDVTLSHSQKTSHCPTKNVPLSH